MNNADIRQLLAAEADWLHRLAYALVHDYWNARDLAQDTLVKVFGNPPKPGPLRPLLKRVLFRSYLSAYRKDDRRVRRERGAHAAGLVPGDDTLQPEAEETLLRMEQKRELLAAQAALEEPLRTIVRLKYEDNLSIAEIAKRLGSNDKAVAKDLRRAIAQMREHFDRRCGSREAWLIALARIARPPAPPPPAATVTMAGAARVVALFAIVASVGGMAWVLVPRPADVAPPGPGPEQPVQVAMVPGPAAAAPEEAAELHRVDAAVVAARYRGVAVDELGRPVPQARVEIWERDATQDLAGVAFSAEDGSFDVVLGPRDPAVHAASLAEEAGLNLVHCMRVTAPGYAPLRIPSEGEYFTPPQEVDGWTDVGSVVLQRGVEVRGRVVDASGAVVPGADLYLLNPERELPRAPANMALPMGRTHADGTFRLDERITGDASVGALSLCLFALSDRGWTFRPINVLRGMDALDDVELVLRTAALDVQVRGEDGSPIAFAKIHVAPMLHGPAGPPRSLPKRLDTHPAWRKLQATTDESGKAALPNLAVVEGAAYAVSVSCSGFVARTETLASVGPQVLDVVLTPERTLRVHGRVEDGRGQPVAGARVYTTRLEAESDEAGRFHLDTRLRSRPLDLRVEAEGHVTRHLNVQPDQLLGELPIVLPPTEPTSVRIVDEHGRTVPDFELRLSRGPEWGKAERVDDGVHLFPFTSRGRWDLGLVYRGKDRWILPTHCAIEGGVLGQQVQVWRAPDPVAVTVTLSDPAAGETVRPFRVACEGVITPPAGAGGLDVDSLRRKLNAVRELGAVRIDHGWPGDWDLWVQLEDGRLLRHRLHVPAGAPAYRQDVPLKPAGGVFGAVHTAGAAVEDVRVALLPADLVAAPPAFGEWPDVDPRPDRFRFERVPPGRYLLQRAGAPGDPVAVQEVDVLPGHDHEVSLVAWD